MEPYSHSRLSIYEQCPHRYRLRYIDGIEMDAMSIEAFTGSVVHGALEHLSSRTGGGRSMEPEELVAYMRGLWDELFRDSIFIARRNASAAEYELKAEAMLLAYYRRHHPFREGTTVGLEHELRFSIFGTREHDMIGYVDRITCLGDGVYEIHDYKTGQRLPSPADLRRDRQLALYEIGLRRSLPDVKEVQLVWHHLAHDRELRSERTKGELEILESETSALIESIEGCNRFPRRKGPLCRWCEYSGMC